MNSPNFNVVSKIMGDVAVLYPQGYLNNIAGESLVHACNSFTEKGIHKIVLNFSGTELINSIGISLLLNIVEGLKDCGGTLCFTNMSNGHQDIFEMLGLTKYIRVFGSENDALSSLRHGTAA